MSRFFAADVVQTVVEQLPTWVWVLAAVGLGLLGVAVLLNQRGFWSSGREKKEILAVKDEQIALLKSELDKANARWKEERDQRLADAQSMTTLKLAAQLGVNAMSEAAEFFNERGDPYAERLGRPRRRAIPSGK